MLYKRFRAKHQGRLESLKTCKNDDTHIQAVKEVISRLFVLQEQAKILKNLKNTQTNVIMYSYCKDWVTANQPISYQSSDANITCTTVAIWNG